MDMGEQIIDLNVNNYTDEDTTKSIIFQTQTSSDVLQKGCKRKNEENLDHSFEFCRPSTSSLKKSRPRKRLNVDPVELHNIIEGMDEEINDALEHSASKNKLSRTNVKNILKHVITNEYVLAMVRNTMKVDSGEGNLEEAIFEPKLTRSKAKELNKDQYSIHWPVPSPMKNVDQVAQQLLEQEFPDESSDDEDYKPNEEEEPSDDDDAASAKSPRTSEVWSPSFTPANVLSPTTLEVEQIPDEDDNDLVIELPDLNPPCETSEADKIALRTRSKLCLNDTPLEEIEASFFAPDLAVDMYDTYCDDIEWLNFLNDLGKPIDTAEKKEQVEVDDTEDDPEYSFHEDEDAPDPLDLTYDQTTKVSRNELNALMAEILEYAQQEYGEDEEEEDHGQNEIPAKPYKSVFTSDDTDVELRSEWMNSDEKLQLDEQMRMYVQILTQVYLLSHGTSDLEFINLSAKLFLDEIKMFASREIGNNKKSAFYAHNLDNALKIINKFEKHNTTPPNLKNKESPTRQCPVPIYAKRTIATNKVFIYPELLPVCGFPPPIFFRKAVFTAAEDNLIALGLEQFSTCDSKVEMIQKLLVPCKSVQQIKIRIKNCSISKVPLDNPIKYYHVYKVAPPPPKFVKLFDPDKIKIPAEFPLDILPRWMKFYCRVASGNPMFVPHNIAPSQIVKPSPPTSAPLVAVVRPTFRKMPERKKSRLILPHGAVFSSLKHVTPILKKYSFPKKTVAVLPFSVSCPYKDKCTGLKKHSQETENTQTNQISKPRAIKPKPVLQTLNTVIDTPMKQLNVSTNAGGNLSSPLVQPLIVVPSSTDQPVQVYVNTSTPLKSPQSNPGCITDQMIPLTPVSTSQNFNTLRQITPDHNSSKFLQSSATLTAAVVESDFEINSKGKSAPKQFVPKVSGTELNLAVADVDLDENIDEDEHDSPMVATVSAKKQTVSKKKNRIHKDLESSLALLKPTMVNNDPKKEEREILYVNSYLLRASESLKGDLETWNLFLMAVCKYQNCTRFPVKLYLELKGILKNYPALLDDFVAFLKPEEAKLVGKFKQYLVLNKIREFLRKVEVHFCNQPQHITKIVRALSQFRQQSYVTSAEAISGLQPLLRNQTHLMEELSQLIPDAAPPVYLQTDFEDISFPNNDEDASSSGSWENITIPDTPDPYGGKECPCKCHSQSTDSKLLNRSRHCVKCGVKFIDGRIYLQTGKVLKPAQVTYHELPSESIDKSSNKNLQKPLLPHEVFLKALAISESVNKQEASKKGGTKELIINSNPVQIATNQPTSSKLPCDVIEDTVFPTMVNTVNKSAPSDFSHLRDMIGTAKERMSSSNQSESEDKPALARKKWSREEDKLIIYNCQRLGMRKEAFIATAKMLKPRTAEEVEDRFFSMVEQLFNTEQSLQI